MNKQAFLAGYIGKQAARGDQVLKLISAAGRDVGPMSFSRINRDPNAVTRLREMLQGSKKTVKHTAEDDVVKGILERNSQEARRLANSAQSARYSQGA